MRKYIKEACVETLEQVVRARKKGADRIELCDRLDLDGTTPSTELILAAKRSGIPVRVIIRPRGGNFIYSKEELEEMKNSISFCKEAGVEGVVFGMQKEDGFLDYTEIGKLAKLAQPLEVVIHKVIDETPDPVDAVKHLIEIAEISGILTSGGKSTAFEGRKILKQMLEVAGNKIEIIAAGKVTEDNISELDEYLKARAYHGKLIVGEL